MAAVEQLTKAEISAQISDPVVKTWWDTAPAFDASFGVVELMIKLCQAGYRAQVTKNASTLPAPVAGEALAGFNAPATSTPVLDVTTGLMSYNISMSVDGVSGTDSDRTVSAYV